jgi:hypothetical protein
MRQTGAVTEPDMMVNAHGSDEIETAIGVGQFARISLNFDREITAFLKHTRGWVASLRPSK